MKMFKNICLASPTFIAVVPAETSSKTVGQQFSFNQALNLHPVKSFRFWLI